MVRMFAILSSMGLVFALVFGLRDGATVQVTLFGNGPPSYDPSNFEDCGPQSSSDGVPEASDDCYAYLRPGADEPLACDYTLGFRAGADARVERLRVRLALMGDGKAIGRDSIEIGSLDRPADDPYVTRTIRADCGAKHVHITEAYAFVDGQETDLIATGDIGSTGLMPLLPDFFIKIGPAAET
jgi:hypothetical protein